MIDKQIQVTDKGLEVLSQELENLIEKKRPQVVARLERARNEGDLSENSDYIAAKEELEFLDGRIDELKYVVDHAEVVDTSSIPEDQVALGTIVTLQVNGDTHEYEIVGEWEADPMKKKISPKSPLGSQLVGKNIGEKVVVEAPAGNVTYEIKEVKSAV